MDSQEDLFPDDDRGGTADVATDPVGEGEDSKTGDGTGIGDNGGHEEGRPKKDRKRRFTVEEALEAKRAAMGNVADACREMLQILMQRTADPENLEEYEAYESELRESASGAASSSCARPTSSSTPCPSAGTVLVH